MLYKYSEYIILEKKLTSTNNLYWDSQFEKLWDMVWQDFSVEKLGDKYIISFRAGDETQDKYGSSVLIEKAGNDDFYYLESSEKFIEKFKTDFWKNASEYVDDMAYDPKCLGDLSHVRDAKRYNL